MILILTSSFSLRPQHGFATSLQSQRTQIHNSNKYKEYKSVMDFLPIASISKCSFGNSYRYKLVREQKVHSPTFCAQSTNEEFILQQKNNHIITPPQSSLWKNVDVFLRFCRLHSIIGGIVGLISISLLPVTSLGDLSPGFFTGLLKAIIPMALINTYTSCLNQVTDVEIDKVNKPHFVLASGEYTMEQGKAIGAALALMAFIMGIYFNSPSLLLGLVAYFFVGTAYSVKLPLLRWKKNPFLAAFVIINILLIVPIVSFIHTQTYVLGRPLVFTKPFAFSLFGNTMFGIALALMKDIPDMEGDKAFGIQTFSLMHGKRKVFDICRSIMLTVYGSAMLIGTLSSSPLNKLITVLGHGALGCILWTRSQSLNLDDVPAVESFYMFSWKLFYAEYLLVHFLR
uniref:Prenyltransferase n=1 Tax=Angelica keiskei TaxID=357850 RepID=A0A810JZD5_9APIA|nr:prenyltransferase [Angelica keiskei]